jgi:hypothetical protein
MEKQYLIFLCLYTVMELDTANHDRVGLQGLWWTILSVLRSTYVCIGSFHALSPPAPPLNTILYKYTISTNSSASFSMERCGLNSAL